MKTRAIAKKTGDSRKTGTPTSLVNPVWRGQVPAIRHLLHGPALQPKLNVGAPDDAYEREADRAADRVMRLSDGEVQATPAPPRLQRLCSDCEEEFRAKPAGTGFNPAVQVPPIVHDVLRSPGKPLAPATRAFFEPRFGQDFSQVRVHADRIAAESSQAVRALAYTVGRHVVFGATLQPRMPSGKAILAHELAHVVQQGAAIPKAAPLPMTTASTPLLSRQESDRVLSGVAPPAILPASSDCNPFDDEGYPLIKFGARRNAVGVAQTQLNRVLAEIAACFPDPACVGGLPQKNQDFIRKHIGMLSKNPIDIDCQFGPDTLHATYAAQAYYFKKEREWDGIIGPNTWYPLDYPLAPKP